MSFTANKVILLGTMGRDAETRAVAQSTVSSFSVATERSWKDKAGNWIKETDWHNIVVWNPSEYLKERLKKGAKVFIEGEMRTDCFEKDNVKQYRTKVVASKIIPLGANEARGESSEQSNQGDQQGEAPPNGEAEEDLPF